MKPVRTKPYMQDAITELCRADYHLACAATVLENLQQPASKEADDLMRQCIALRERLTAQRS